MPDPPPTPRLPGVEVIEELGRGATSTVYRITRDGADYALKLFETSAEPALALSSLRREVALMAGARHPGLARFHDVGLFSSRPYVVTDLIPGRPLADLLAERPLTPDAAVALAVDVTGALIALHRRGLVHGHLTPSNIVIDPQGVAHVIDPWLGTRQGAGDAPGPAANTEATCTEATSTDHPVPDPRADLRALGALILQSLTASPSPLPHAGADSPSAAPASEHRPRVLPAQVPPGLALCLARLLVDDAADDAADRYGSASALLSDLLALAPALERGLPACVTTSSAPHGPAEDTDGTDEALCGRDEELTGLTTRWEAARRSAGGAVLLVGEPGAGKKRLARELSATVRAAARRAGRGEAGGRAGGAVVLHAGCEPGQAPLTAIRSALDSHARWAAALPDGDREPVTVSLRAAAAPALPLITELSHGLGELLGVRRSSPDESRCAQIPQVAADFLADLSLQCGALLLVLDDVHRLDPGSLTVLRLLARRWDHLPLLVLGTASQDPPGLERATPVGCAPDEGALRLDVRPLDLAALRELVSAVLPGSGATTQLARRLLLLSGGNVLMAQECLRAVIDAGLLRPAWGTWILDEVGLDALALPPDPAGVVLSRISGLGPGAVRVLTAAASVGGPFEPQRVAGVYGLSEELVADVVAMAERRRLLVRREGNLVDFGQDRVRDWLTRPLPTATFPGGPDHWIPAPRRP